MDAAYQLQSPPTQALIIGASRGVGCGFVQALHQDHRVERIFCAMRDPDQPNALSSLMASEPERIVPLRIDVTDEDSIAHAAQSLIDVDASLDWVINTVGLLHDAHGIQPERRLRDIDASNIQASFSVNSIGPILLAKHLTALLPRRSPSIWATLSARVGSITDNRLGGWYAYRAAKAAQNMLTKTLSIELRRSHKQIRVVALHPGTVATDLSAPFRGNVGKEQLFSVDQSVNYLLQVLDGLKDDDNGSFFAWDGQQIAW